MDNHPFSGAPPATERRKVERRRDTAKYKLLSRLLALRRAFGVETSIKFALKIGFSADDAARFVEIGRERRLLRRRESLPVFKPSRRPRAERAIDIQAQTLNNADIEALRWLAHKKPVGGRLRPGDYSAKLLGLGFIFRNCDGEPVLTYKGQQALLQRSYVHGALLVRKTGHCALLDASVREWLETNRFISATSAGGCVITPKGSTWLDTMLPSSERVDQSSVRGAR